MPPNKPAAAAPPLFEVRTRISSGTARAISLASVVLLFAAWFLTTMGERPLIDPLKLPPPSEVLRALVQLMFTDLGPELGVSVMRVSIAFVLCIAVSVPLGVLMGSFEAFNRWVDPIISPLRFTPMNAFVPIFIMWFGIDETEK